MNETYGVRKEMHLAALERLPDLSTRNLSCYTMLAWLSRHPEKMSRAGSRILEAMREIGVLLLLLTLGLEYAP